MVAAETMTLLALAIPSEEHEGDFVPEALATAVTLTRWGIRQEARDGALVLSASDGVMYGITHQGHLRGAILEHAGALYRLARLTTR